MALWRPLWRCGPFLPECASAPRVRFKGVILGILLAVTVDRLTRRRRRCTATVLPWLVLAASCIARAFLFWLMFIMLVLPCFFIITSVIVLPCFFTIVLVSLCLCTIVLVLPFFIITLVSGLVLPFFIIFGLVWPNADHLASSSLLLTGDPFPETQATSRRAL